MVFVADENELNEEPCVVNKTEIDGNFTLTSKEIPQYYLNKANRTGMECLFQIFVAQGKLVCHFNVHLGNVAALYVIWTIYRHPYRF